MNELFNNYFIFMQKNQTFWKTIGLFQKTYGFFQKTITFSQKPITFPEKTIGFPEKTIGFQETASELLKKMNKNNYYDIK